MTFIAAGIIAAGAIGGAYISSQGSKKAAGIAAGGSQAELDLIRESRDIARADQGPYREAGYTALNALMSLTGLAAPSGGATGDSRTNPRGLGGGRGGINASDYLRGLRPIKGGGGGRYPMIHHRAGGGNVYGRNQGGAIYNVNEFGPERIYENGSYTRSDMPRTISPSGDGYVAPNVPAIQGAGFGSFLKKMVNPINASRPIRTAQGKDPYPYLMGRSGAPGGTGYYRDNPRIEGGPAGPNTPIPNQDFGDPLAGTYQPPGENPGGVAGGYQFQTDPGYNFRLGEGMRTLERGAAARGGLLSGGYGRRSTRYAQDYASNEYSNVYNRIANIAGLGQVSAQSSGNQALMAGQGMGTAAAQGAYASAYGQQAGTNAWANAANQLAQMPWGQIFNRGGTTPQSSGGGGFRL
jgi:hypothetical protein